MRQWRGKCKGDVGGYPQSDQLYSRKIRGFFPTAHGCFQSTVANQILPVPLTERLFRTFSHLIILPFQKNPLSPLFAIGPRHGFLPTESLCTSCRPTT
jgi:hypothetical protein